jgi:hypothetical protein
MKAFIFAPNTMESMRATALSLFHFLGKRMVFYLEAFHNANCGFDCQWVGLL